MNLQMQVVDVTDENAIVLVIEKVQVSFLLLRVNLKVAKFQKSFKTPEKPQVSFSWNLHKTWKSH